MVASVADLRRELSITVEAPPAPAWALWTMRAAAALGASVAAYLAWVTLATARVAGCGVGLFDCNLVLTSRWSSWLHIPVAFLAVSLFVSLLVTLFFAGPRVPSAVRRVSATLVLGLATAAAGAAAWFLGVMLFNLQHVCPWCVVVHTCSLTIAVLAWRYVSETTEALRPLGTLGLLGTATLVVGQLAVAPTPTYVVTKTGAVTDKPVLVLGEKKGAPEHAPAKTPAPATSAGNSEPAPPVAQGSAPEEPPHAAAPAPKSTSIDASDLIVDPAERTATVTALKPATALPDAPQPTPRTLPFAQNGAGKERMIAALGGQVKVNVYAQPHLGNPAAPYVVVKLFDYTCHHCRQMHKLLEAARTRYGEQLCVVLLPVPLNSNCNPYVRQTPAAHQHACAMALYALAVYRAQPEAFPEFDRWLFAPDTPPTEAAAFAKAVELVGEDALKLALRDGVVERQIRDNAQVYSLCGAGVIPKLLFRETMEKGRMDAPEQLFKLLETEFPDMKPQPPAAAGE